jgi:hypothetical protein
VSSELCSQSTSNLNPNVAGAATVTWHCRLALTLGDWRHCANRAIHVPARIAFTAQLY